MHYRIFPYEELRYIIQLAGNLTASNLDSRHHYSGYFYRKKSFFEQHGGHDYDVVFIGDSITDGAEWEDLFPSVKIANRGIEGDTTYGVIERLNSIYSTNARKAFIMIGINDLFNGDEVADIFGRYKTIIEKLTAYGMQVYVQSIIIVGKRKEQINLKVIVLNDMLKKISEEEISVTYIDLNIGLVKNLLLDPRYSNDDVHLNGSGYAVWKNIIKGYLQ